MATIKPAVGDDEPPLKTFADRLTYLFGTVYPAGRDPYSLREVADGLKAMGESMSPQYLDFLRSGKRVNPTANVVVALGKFFGVPAGFLLGDENSPKVAAELQRLAAARDVQEALNNPDILVLAQRARGLSGPHLRLVIAMLDEVRNLEVGEQATRATSRRRRPRSDPAPPPAGTGP